MEAPSPLSPSPTAAAPLLTFEEARVLGCLMEKERTTPEYYPLTLNQLVAACNQTTNRDPVTAFDERTVTRALDGLRERQLAFQVSLAGARVQKYKHNAGSKFPRLDQPSSALLCVLLLRGQQTAGELRQRTERLHAFPDLPSVETAMKELIDYPEAPLAALLPPGGGRKTVSYMHLLCGPVEAQAPRVMIVPSSRSSEDSAADSGRLERLERELQEMSAEVAQLRDRVARLELDADLRDTQEPPPAIDSVHIP